MKLLKLLDRLNDFNGMKTRLGLFYALMFGNCVSCRFIFTLFCVVVSYEFVIIVVVVVVVVFDAHGPIEYK